MSRLWRSGGIAVAGAVLVYPLRVGAAAEAHAAQHAPSIVDLVFPLINFAIFAFLVVRYVVPAAREYLRRRERDIVVALEESQAALSAAEEALASAKERRATLAEECAAVRRDVVAGASLQVERLRALAEASAKRRGADTLPVAGQERRWAIQSLRVEAATVAAAIAEARIRKVLSVEDQRQYVRRFLEDAPTR